MLKWNKIGIKNRLFIIFIIIQLLIIALSFYYFSSNHRNFYLEQERISLRHYTNLIIDEIKEDGYNFNSQYLESKVDIWSDNTESRITAVDIDGKVLADSHHDIEKMDNHKNRPEIKSALDSNKASSSIRYSNTIDEDMLYLAQTITIDGQTVGVLRSARSLNLIRDVLIDDIKSYLFFFVILALITVYLSWKLTSGIVKPLEKITETAGKISEGDLSQRIPVRKYSSEIENLAKSFNYMASELEGKIKEISQEKNRIETILESMVDGVIATDKDGRITLINPAAQEIFNIDKEQTKGKELISTLFSHRIDMYLERALEKRESISREINYQNPEKKIIQATFIPLIDNKNNVNGGVIVLTDITELRKLETVRNDFVANVSHELRTPLTSILGYLDTLIESDIKDQEINSCA